MHSQAGSQSFARRTCGWSEAQLIFLPPAFIQSLVPDDARHNILPNMLRQFFEMRTADLAVQCAPPNTACKFPRKSLLCSARHDIIARRACINFCIPRCPSKLCYPMRSWI